MRGTNIRLIHSTLSGETNKKQKKMGGANSKTEVESITEKLRDVTSSQFQSCVMSVALDQSLFIGDVKGDVTISGLTQKQTSVMNVKCAQSTDKIEAIQSSLASSLETIQQKKMQGTAGLTAGESDVNTTNKQKIVENIKSEIVNNLESLMSQSQKIEIVNVGGNVALKDITQEQAATMAADAVLKAASVRNAITKFSTDMSTTSVTTEENTLAGIVTSIGGVVSNIGGAVKDALQGTSLMIIVMILGGLAALTFIVKVLGIDITKFIPRIPGT